MEKSRKRKKECSAKGCRKSAIDEGKCRLHAAVKDSAVTERVVSGHRIQSTAKKISRVRKTHALQESSSKASVAEFHGKKFESHAGARRRDAYGYRALCFNAGKILGSVGAYLEGE